MAGSLACGVCWPRSRFQTSTKAWASASRQDRPLSSRALARWPHSSRHASGQLPRTRRYSGG
ncbi:MAG: hypothetical protein ACLQIB_18790 [Isosphaeraceae bacterium]